MCSAFRSTLKSHHRFNLNFANLVSCEHRSVSLGNSQCIVFNEISVVVTQCTDNMLICHLPFVHMPSLQLLTTSVLLLTSNNNNRYKSQCIALSTCEIMPTGLLPIR